MRRSKWHLYSIKRPGDRTAKLRNRMSFGSLSLRIRPDDSGFGAAHSRDSARLLRWKFNAIDVVCSKHNMRGKLRSLHASDLTPVPDHGSVKQALARGARYVALGPPIRSVGRSGFCRWT